MKGHGISQSIKNMREDTKKRILDIPKRFAANPDVKKAMVEGSSGNKVKDILLAKNVRNANKYIKALKKGGSVISDDVRKTRNNELAKVLAVYAAPVAIAGTGVAVSKKIKKRKDDEEMNKMSAEDYAGFVDKLAEEIVDGMYAEDVEDEGMEVTAGEDFDEIAERAFMAYESAQMIKEASENAYTEAQAYEDAALIILDELNDEDYE